MTRKRRLRGRRAGLAFQSAGARAPPLGRRPPLAPPLADLQVSFCRMLRTRARLARFRRRERHASAPRLREPDRDRLLARARTMLALPDVIHLLAHELASGSARALALLQIPLRSLHGLLFRHHVLLQSTARTCRGDHDAWTVRLVLPVPCTIRSKNARHQAPSAGTRVSAVSDEGFARNGALQQRHGRPSPYRRDPEPAVRLSS